MSAARKLENAGYTYEEYLQVPESGVRLELIDGEIFAMASANTRHQRVVRKLIRKIDGHIGDGGSCEIFTDLDTRLNFAKCDDTALRPDLLVVCDPSKVGENSINGAPDLVIEILSPSTARRDLRVKLAKYCEAGVREIWIVDPMRDVVMTYIRNEAGAYESKIYDVDDEIPMHIFEGFVIQGSDIFDNTDEATEEGI